MEIYRMLREAPSFPAFFRMFFSARRNQSRATALPISQGETRRRIMQEREAVIAQSLETQEARQALATAMVEPIRRALDYQAVGRRLLMVDEIPQGAHATYSNEMDRIIGLLDQRTRNTSVHEIVHATPRFMELSVVSAPYMPNVLIKRKSYPYPALMCINKSCKKGLIKAKVLVLS